jgi:hypothetical protein
MRVLNKAVWPHQVTLDPTFLPDEEYGVYDVRERWLRENMYENYPNRWHIVGYKPLTYCFSDSNDYMMFLLSCA